MVYVFGINLPVAELMFIAVLFFLVGLGFMIWQTLQVRKHMEVLERTTFEIKKYEEQEQSEVERLESDVKNFENDEAELFVARVVPTIAKLENFVMAQLFHGKEPEMVIDTLVAKKIDKELATRVVNQVAYYLNFYHKLPNKKENDHHATVSKLQMPSGKNAPNMPEVKFQGLPPVKNTPGPKTPNKTPSKTPAKSPAKSAKR